MSRHVKEENVFLLLVDNIKTRIDFSLDVPAAGVGRDCPCDFTKPATAMYIKGQRATVALIAERLEGLLGHPAVEFIRRFLLHILPKGFVRIRQYGFLANRARGDKLALCRNLLGAAVKDVVDDRDKKEPVPRHCPVCKTGHMISIGIVSAMRSPPPLQDST